MNYILTISRATPTTNGRREHSRAVKALKETNWFKVAPNTFFGQAKNLDAAMLQMKSIIPHAANWRFFEVGAQGVIAGANYPRR